jgi:hypothetical protein
MWPMQVTDQEMARYTCKVVKYRGANLSEPLRISSNPTGRLIVSLHSTAPAQPKVYENISSSTTKSHVLYEMRPNQLGLSEVVLHLAI